MLFTSSFPTLIDLASAYVALPTLMNRTISDIKNGEEPLRSLPDEIEIICYSSKGEGVPHLLLRLFHPIF